MIKPPTMDGTWRKEENVGVGASLEDIVSAARRVKGSRRERAW